jgi:hypothetical protein
MSKRFVILDDIEVLKSQRSNVPLNVVKTKIAKFIGDFLKKEKDYLKKKVYIDTDTSGLADVDSSTIIHMTTSFEMGLNEFMIRLIYGTSNLVFRFEILPDISLYLGKHDIRISTKLIKSAHYNKWFQQMEFWRIYNGINYDFVLSYELTQERLLIKKKEMVVKKSYSESFEDRFSRIMQVMKDKGFVSNYKFIFEKDISDVLEEFILLLSMEHEHEGFKFLYFIVDYKFYILIYNELTKSSLLIEPIHSEQFKEKTEKEYAELFYNQIKFEFSRDLTKDRYLDGI